jgi:uncharacterized membrane protein YphA (DoxX/SURF4 family)
MGESHGETTGETDTTSQTSACSEIARITTATATILPDSATLARWGLAGMLLAAGAHKLLQPAAWAVYVTDWLAPWLVVSPVLFMLVNGWLELGFAGLLLADRYTAFAATVAAVSLFATISYLVVVWLLSGRFGDVIARDVGLLALALVVFADSIKNSQQNQQK